MAPNSIPARVRATVQHTTIRVMLVKDMTKGMLTQPTVRHPCANTATIHITRIRARLTATTGLAGSPAVSLSAPDPGTAVIVVTMDGLGIGPSAVDRATGRLTADPGI